MRTLVIIICSIFIACSSTKTAKTNTFYLFSEVTEKPMFNDCKKVSKNKQSQCFEEELKKHIIKNFSYPMEAIKKHIQGRVDMSFTITKEGTIKIESIEGPDPILENAAREILYKIPQLIPGKVKDEAVDVLYNYPLYFELNN